MPKDTKDTKLSHTGNSVRNTVKKKMGRCLIIGFNPSLLVLVEKNTQKNKTEKDQPGLHNEVELKDTSNSPGTEDRILSKTRGSKASHLLSPKEIRIHS